MKLKWIVITILAIASLNSGYASHNKHHHRHSHKQPVSVLLESPETYEIVSLLTIYQTYDANGPIQLRRIGKAYDGGYVIPELAIEQADAVLGYGISDDISFEESASTIYQKPSYGFDGTCQPVMVHNDLCHFIPLCIVSKNRSLSANEKASSFEQQLDMLNIRDKNLFVKMDIEGNEYDTLPDILQYASNITGIVLEIHFNAINQVSQALSLIKELDKNFLLIHVHGNCCCQEFFTTKNSSGLLPRVLELSYINKHLIQHYTVSIDQTHPTKLDMPNAPNKPDLVFSILGSVKQ